MGTFLRSRHGIDYERGFVQGAGRILIAPADTAFPAGLEDILVLTAGATQYDIVAPYEEVGFTKTGINITTIITAVIGAVLVVVVVGLVRGGRTGRGAI